MYMNENGALCYSADEATEKTCPVCGSDQIEETDSEEHEGDEYMGYGFKCPLCGAGGYRSYIRVFDGYVVTEIPPESVTPNEAALIGTGGTLKEMSMTYIPLLRPAGFQSLPRGIEWEYIEAPAALGIASRPDLPRSNHLYGVIRTNRPLTDEECQRFSLKPQKGQGDKGRKLRLILFEECSGSCEGCCNNDFDLPGLPVCESYKGYELIMLTGGEPMLHPEKVLEAVSRIRRETDASIILYTALTSDKEVLSRIIEQIEGVTVTLHDNSDVKPFLEFDDYHVGAVGISKSYRLNVFKGVEINLESIKGRWKVKSDIEWIKDCPLPEGEVLMRFESSERM